MGVLTLAALGLGACSDDETPVVSQDDYDDAAQELCTRQDTARYDEAIDFTTSTLSDAERVALIRAEFVPRNRAIVLGLESTGFPSAQAGEYRSALSGTLVALQEIEDDSYVLIDRLRRGDLPADENPFLRVDEGFLAADIPC